MNSFVQVRIVNCDTLDGGDGTTKLENSEQLASYLKLRVHYKNIF